jgi:propionyl-CoA carboxylase beta chain
VPIIQPPLRHQELILKVADEGSFFELGGLLKNIVTGFGRVDGCTVGFVANQPMVSPACCYDTSAQEPPASFLHNAFGIRS